ncbi:hypothetical protein GBA63_06565 [Rubrobacter tropicus]|uniref:Uncharacterized protein n=1 Tax=Rubrobacter tropicus TaxID=2653851 RepID=A0A6G8Q7D0_9ACTN|nr:hypothetical protein [Rubrobacter tropicus]QIN82352.1 hypothetical protein GBA63_06565 [Rubrobacter tropicus]
MEERGGPVRVGSERENKHSRLGVASFVIAVLTTVLFIVLLVVIFGAAGQLLGNEDPQSVTPQDLQQNLEESPGTTGVLGVAGFGLVASPFLYLLGAALGTAGLIQKRRKRLFAVLGTVANGVIFLGLLALVLFLVVVGTTIQP